MTRNPSLSAACLWRLLLPLLACLAVSCAAPADPYAPIRNAISAELLRMNPEYDSVTFSEVRAVGVSTYADEIERRRRVFVERVKQDARLQAKYEEERKPKNVRRKAEDVRLDMAMVDAIDSLAREMHDVLGDVAFYEILFSATATGDDGVLRCNDVYADVTPSGEVVNICTRKRDLYKGTGIVLPGYAALLHRFKMDREDFRNSL